MNAPTFIDSLRERGATLQIEGERLRVTPSTALTDADRAAWREHKREIIVLLESASQADAQSSTRPATIADIDPLDFVATVRRIRRNLPSCMIKMPDAEQREYSFAVACLICGIDPACKAVDALCFDSMPTVTGEINP